MFTKLEKTLLVFILTFAVLCLIARSCNGEEINSALINAIICVESGWDSQVVSEKGCIGLMQINPDGALKEYNQWYGYTFDNEGKNALATDKVYRFVRENPEGFNVGDLLNPRINVAIGRWYLNRLKEHYIPKDKFSLENLLAAYNGGITRLRKVNYDWTKMPRETRDYVRKVLRIYYGRN